MTVAPEKNSVVLSIKVGLFLAFLCPCGLCLLGAWSVRVVRPSVDPVKIFVPSRISGPKW